jgi:hypothetical protein
MSVHKEGGSANSRSVRWTDADRENFMHYRHVAATKPAEFQRFLRAVEVTVRRLVGALEITTLA